MQTELPTFIKGPFPPSVVSLPTGRFLVGGERWYRVGENFTYEDAQKLWQRETYATPHKQVQSTLRIPSSKPGKFYTVTNDGFGWSCTCVGFGYRRDCRHVQTAKSMV